MKLYNAIILNTNKGKFIYDGLANALYKISYEIHQILSAEEDEGNNMGLYYSYIKENGIRDVTVPAQIEIAHSYTIDMLKRLINSRRKFLTLSLTNKCNLNCTYCIYHDKFMETANMNHTMSFETARKAIDHLFEESINMDRLHIGFYGGESLLEFELIKKCIDYVDEINNGVKVTYGMTTNGVLLDKQKRRYLEEHDFAITVSLDGPKSIHDRYRRTKSGAGSFDIVINNLKEWYNENEEFVKRKIIFNSVEAPPTNIQVLDDFFSNTPIITMYNGMESTAYFEKNVCTYSNEYIDRVNQRNDVEYSEKYQNQILTSFMKYIPTKFEIPEVVMPGGTCIPIFLRWYVNSFGKYYPCERLPELEKYCIGDVDNDIDYEKIIKLYDNFISTAQKKCKDCWAVGLCGRCFDSINEKCDSLLNQLENNYIYYIENIHDDKKLFDKLKTIDIEL